LPDLVFGVPGSEAGINSSQERSVAVPQLSSGLQRGLQVQAELLGAMESREQWSPSVGGLGRFDVPLWHSGVQQEIGVPLVATVLLDRGSFGVQPCWTRSGCSFVGAGLGGGDFGAGGGEDLAQDVLG
jgi:hypothetical protein